MWWRTNFTLRRNGQMFRGQRLSGKQTLSLKPKYVSCFFSTFERLQCKYLDLAIKTLLSY